jgi:hypothetical protein
MRPAWSIRPWSARSRLLALLGVVIRLQPHGLSHDAIQVGFGHITADQYCGVSHGCPLLHSGLVLCDVGLGNSGAAIQAREPFLETIRIQILLWRLYKGKSGALLWTVRRVRLALDRPHRQRDG